MSEVLVVGAGPTGLSMAAQLHAHGVRLRIVERRQQRRASRAFVVHPRTLELLAPLGLTEPLLARGEPNVEVRLHAKSRTADVRLVASGFTDTAYPHLLFIPQSAVEEVLEDHLREVGVLVERGVELIGSSQRPGSVDYRLRLDDGSLESGKASYLLGCDGADSTVRRQAGITFRTRPYRPSLVLADLDLDGELASGRFHGFVSGEGLLFLFPSHGAAAWRLLSVRPDGGVATGVSTEAAPDALMDLQALVDRFTGGALRLHPPVWSAYLRLRRGQADRYRRGRILVAGDAAHLHSPAAAQGMNTGIQDACNLAWKVALVASGAASEELLDSYETERWPVARRTRQLTDLAFMAEAGDQMPLRWLRQHATWRVLPLVDGRSIPRFAFRLLGGLVTRYRHHAIVQGGYLSLFRGPRTGDRFPDGRILAAGQPGWLHPHLREPAHHLLLCGPQAEFDWSSTERIIGGSTVPLRIHRLSPVADEGALVDPEGGLLRRLGVTRTAVYLVRPDGYIAIRSDGPDLGAVGRYLRDLRQPRRPDRARPGARTVSAWIRTPSLWWSHESSRDHTYTKRHAGGGTSDQAAVVDRWYLSTRFRARRRGRRGW
jgi:2-polyprenyl-6-methoxyphenol hydroxylase-like FAD-dependent oxidoreductase